MKFADFFRDLGPVVSYHPRINRITGSVTATIFMSNLLAWEGHQKDGDGWIYKTRDAIHGETGLTRSEQETARRHLREKGFLEEKLRGVPATMHYRLDLDAINDAWESTNKPVETPPTSRRKSRQLKGDEAADKMATIPPTIPEYTPEITQKELQSDTAASGGARLARPSPLPPAVFDFPQMKRDPAEISAELRAEWAKHKKVTRR
jgi:hypothetical protein